MPHECCTLDIVKIRTEIVAISKEIRELKNKRRDAVKLPLESPERAAALTKYDHHGLKWTATLLCALRARHHNKKHIQKFPFLPWGQGAVDEKAFLAALDFFAKRYQRTESTSSVAA